MALQHVNFAELKSFIGSEIKDRITQKQARETETQRRHKEYIAGNEKRAQEYLESFPQMIREMLNFQDFFDIAEENESGIYMVVLLPHNDFLETMPDELPPEFPLWIRLVYTKLIEMGFKKNLYFYVSPHDGKFDHYLRFNPTL